MFGARDRKADEEHIFAIELSKYIPKPTLASRKDRIGDVPACATGLSECPETIFSCCVS